MAKSARASSRKVNNQRLKARVFGPVEKARTLRLSAKLLELAAAPKPERPDEEAMRIVGVDEVADKDGTKTAAVDTAASAAVAASDDIAMDVDTAKSAAAPSKSSTKKGRIEKRKKASKIVFPKYGDKAKKKKN
ncbi:hypothetical protein F4861DRAFT_168302 [Xylaria intraflava]|nr:hypothetical protein F4861DRAFT_168302 [Xylaria intraflava]